MKTFIVTIEETVAQDFEVEAENSENAMQIAEEKYNSGKFVLEPGNPVCKQMAIVEPSTENTEWIEF